MKITEAITTLQQVLTEHGDLEMGIVEDCEAHPGVELYVNVGLEVVGMLADGPWYCVLTRPLITEEVKPRLKLVEANEPT